MPQQEPFAAYQRRSAFSRTTDRGLTDEERARIVDRAIQTIPQVFDAGAIMDAAEETRDAAREHLRQVIRRQVEQLHHADESLQVTAAEEEALALEVIHAVFGLGFLEQLLPPHRTDLQEIAILTDGTVMVWPKGGRYFEPAGIALADPAQVDSVLTRILGPLNRRVSFANPIVPARLPATNRLPAGARVFVVAPPAVVGAGFPSVNVRLYEEKIITPQTLLDWGVMTPEMDAFFRDRIRELCGIMVAGKTGSGKTTFLNYLSYYIPAEDRVITVEDSAELRLSSPAGVRHHWIALETRPPNIEGEGEIDFMDLVNATLRMTPRWVIVGEIRRGDVAVALLQTQISGHGGMTTIHAKSAVEAIDTLLMRCLQSDEFRQAEAAKRFIVRALDLVVHLGEDDAGHRHITDVAMVRPQMRHGDVWLDYLYRYDKDRSTPGHPVWKTPTELGTVYQRSLEDEES